MSLAFSLLDKECQALGLRRGVLVEHVFTAMSTFHAISWARMGEQRIDVGKVLLKYRIFCCFRRVTNPAVL